MKLVDLKLVRSVSRFERLPLFYLPVCRRESDMRIECHFFVVAPFALLGIMVGNALWSMYRDILECAFLIEEWKKGKARVL